MSEILYIAPNFENSSRERGLTLPLQTGGQWIVGLLFVLVPFTLVSTALPQHSLANYALFMEKLFCASLLLAAVLTALRIAENFLARSLSVACIVAETLASLFIGAMLFALTLGMILVLNAYHLAATKTWEIAFGMIP